ncbi:hypothetical protein [Azospirillum halopraeferens]|uniref:hypothetical protein n=1 Tax=Azospirillum halopraeferens TaxID=34010 RepID=UPI00040A5F48|nr:hypothetical protein [Azospirillum halopraeferens]
MSSMPESLHSPLAAVRRLQAAYTACPTPQGLVALARAHAAAGDVAAARRLAREVVDAVDRDPDGTPPWLADDARAILDGADGRAPNAPASAQDLVGRIVRLAAWPRRVVVDADGVAVYCRRPETALDLLDGIVVHRVVVVGVGSDVDPDLELRVAEVLQACTCGDLPGVHGERALRDLAGDLADLGRRLLLGHHRSPGQPEVTAVVAIAPHHTLSLDVVVSL